MSDNEQPRGSAAGCLVGVLIIASVVLMLVYALRGHQ